MSINKILDTLETDERLSGWQVREVDKRSQQYFLNKDHEEGRRRVNTVSYELEILLTRKVKTERGAQWVTGNAKFNIDPADLGRLEKHLDVALASAELVQNEMYTMTEVAGLMPQVLLSDPLLEKDAEGQVLAGAAELRDSAAREKGVRLVAGEFFADAYRTRYFNSQGVNCLFESTQFSGEFCLLAQGAKGETEVFQAFKRRRLIDCGIAKAVAEAAEKSRQRTTARLPKTGSFDVAFTGEALDHFFAWFVTQASGAAKYNRLTQAETGHMLAEPKPGATPLTLWHNALLPWGVGSYKVDPSGTPGGKRMLIDAGRLKSRQTNARYAQYLKLSPTGEMGNVEVDPGKESAAALLQPAEGRPLYVLSDFSYFEPNGITGEFSSEIRFGLEKQGTSSQPVSGGSVSGLSSEAVSGAKFSSEREMRERYFGPQVIRCENLTFAGA
jgi:predicted Zn-dependent protease